jgi:hypothetical protein
VVGRCWAPGLCLEDLLNCAWHPVGYTLSEAATPCRFVGHYKYHPLYILYILLCILLILWNYIVINYVHLCGTRVIFFYHVILVHGKKIPSPTRSGLCLKTIQLEKAQNIRAVLLLSYNAHTRSAKMAIELPPSLRPMTWTWLVPAASPGNGETASVIPRSASSTARPRMSSAAPRRPCSFQRSVGMAVTTRPVSSTCLPGRPFAWPHHQRLRPRQRLQRLPLLRAGWLW